MLKKQVLEISGEQLYILLKKAIVVAIEEIEANSYIIGPEIMFEYNDQVHFIGVKYNKKKAKKEKRTTFSSELLLVYLDKNEFSSENQLYEEAFIGTDKMKDIKNGIIISTEFKIYL